MRISLFLALAALGLMFVSAAGLTQAELPPLLQEIEQKYQNAATLSANFVQVNESAAFKRKEKSTGVIRFKRPDKIRWETHEPDMSVLVSDGRKFWFYTPPIDPDDKNDQGQVIEKKSAEIQSRLAQSLLSGKFSMAKDMKLKQAGASVFVLTPKRGTAGSVVRARIEVNSEKKLIEKVTLEHRGGNKSEISLSDIQLGLDLPDPMFVFTPPPNTDRVK